ncbi:P-loop containing nucleoside triphosphate hydrolase protein [Xylogone sp. PMI_703]|nr:P-loop containing nucleoside triphosphate hydrolase protein [Xylogone sp. PMI_703]
MSPQISIIFILGLPGAGKSTLSARLAENFPVQHVSVGELLRRITRNETAYPQAGHLASKVAKQELLSAEVLVPILRNEFEELQLRKPGTRVILVDGFPRDLSQQRGFEEAIGEPILVLYFNCPKEIAKQRYLTRNLKGREADDEPMFEKRCAEYMGRNKDIISGYRERRLLIEINTGEALEESWERLCSELSKNNRWMRVIREKI